MPIQSVATAALWGGRKPEGSITSRKKIYIKTLLAAASLFFSAFTLYAQVTVINSLPYTIYNTGYYTLNRDLEFSGNVNAITISDAQDVILDLGGFAIIRSGITGDSAAAIAITTPFPSAAETHSIVVRNGTISKGNAETVPFGVGVLLSHASFCTIDNLIILATTGISDTTGYDNKISNCHLSSGVFLNGCTNDSVIGNDIISGGGLGAGPWGVFSTGSTATMVANNYIHGAPRSSQRGMQLSATDVWWADFFPGLSGNDHVEGGIHGQP